MVLRGADLDWKGAGPRPKVFKACWQQLRPGSDHGIRKLAAFPARGARRRIVCARGRGARSRWSDVGQLWVQGEINGVAPQHRILSTESAEGARSDAAALSEASAFVYDGHVATLRCPDCSNVGHHFVDDLLLDIAAFQALMPVGST